MKRGEPPKRKTPLPRSTKPIKRTELKRGTTPIPQRRDRPRTTKTEQAPDFCSWKDGSAEVRRRANGHCEAGITCRGAGPHNQTHHRKLRRAGDHRPGNLIAVCYKCHSTIHENPLDAHEHGYLVWQHEDPYAVPIVPWVIAP